ncbi:MAG: hemerythrin domain-containing protein [Planctomycetota bacterium]
MNEAQLPSNVLKSEHVVIMRVIRVLQRCVERSRNSGPFDVKIMRKCVDFFQNFADACHHAKEEDLLFPALEERGIPRESGPIGVMLAEHRMARQLTAEMSDALDGFQDTAADRDAFHGPAIAYAALLVDHIFKEDNVLFNMGDRVLQPADQESLCRKFCEVGCRKFSGRTKEELTSMADEIEAACAAE